MIHEPAWVEHAIWWQVYPLGFSGADTTGADRTLTHRLPHLIGWLDHAVELGASGLALGPVFTSSTHGYDTLDHLGIDPRLGDDADFDALVAACRERGLRVLLDGVFNHVGSDHPRLPELAGKGVFEGHDALVTLDHASPAVADLVVDVMCHWLDRGADGWRLDAAYAVPTSFWARVLPRVRERHPDAWVVGEVIHGAYADVVRDSTVDAVTQYELWKAVWSSLNDRNLFELSAALERHNALLESFAPLTFVGNHDVTRLATKVEDPRHRAHALVVLLTVGGTPSIYYGDELGLTGLKEDRAGGDDAVRPAFPVQPGELPDVFRLHQELIGLRRRHAWLHRARTEVVSLANEVLVYDVIGQGRLRVVLNLSDTPVKADGELLAGGGSPVPAHGWAVLQA